jgi:hypothetical protein
MSSAVSPDLPLHPLVQDNCVHRDLYTDAAPLLRVFFAVLTSSAVALSCLRPVYTEMFRSRSMADDESDLCFITVPLKIFPTCRKKLVR